MICVNVEPDVTDEPACPCAGLGGCLWCGTYEWPDEPVCEPVRWATPGVYDDQPATSTVGPLIAQLARVLSQLAELDPVALSGGQALAEAQLLLDAQRRLRVLMLSRLEDVTERRLFDEAGFRSTGAWLSSVAPDAAASDRTLARRLEALPHLRSAVETGELSLTAASRVAEAVVRLRPWLDQPSGEIDGQPGEDVITAVIDNAVDVICREKFGLSVDDPSRAGLLARLDQQAAAISGSGDTQCGRIEQVGVLLAEHLSTRALRAALEELEFALLPNLLEQQQERAHDKRELVLAKNDDGSWHVEGTLTPECGERLFTALAAEARRDPANPSDTSLWSQHKAGASEVRPRNRRQRFHDALDRLLERYLSAGLGGSVHKQPVQVTVTVSAATVEGRPGAPPARSGSGRALARSLLRRWWCDAQVTTLVMSRGWVPLGVVHEGRTLTAAERRAALVQFDNRCAGDGCCLAQPDPLVALVPHHVVGHAVAGRTSLGETVLACPTLHHDLHTGKRTVRLRDGRLLTENGFV